MYMQHRVFLLDDGDITPFLFFSETMEDTEKILPVHVSETA